jgi:sulfur carrier protein
MLEITFNNIQVKLSSVTTLQEFLTANGYHDHYFAVAINRIFISKTNYQHTLLQSGDIVDIITPMQGG